MVVHRNAVSSGPDPYEQAIERLSLSLRGRIVRRGDDVYDAARSIWNAAYAGSPALIVQPVDSQDVARAVAFARRHDLSIAVRSGGHGMAGHGTATGGLQIDLSLMKGIEIDPERRVARAETGLTWPSTPVMRDSTAWRRPPETWAASGSVD